MPETETDAMSIEDDDGEDLFAEDPGPEPESTEEPEPEPEPEADEKDEKQPTEYVALIANRSGFAPSVDEEGDLVKYEGFRREQVLDELIEAGTIKHNSEGLTPEVAIIPARSFVVMRDQVQTRRRVLKS